MENPIPVEIPDRGEAQASLRSNSIHRLPLEYSWQVAKTIVAFPWSWFRKLLRRLWALLRHLLMGPVGLATWIFYAFRSLFQLFPVDIFEMYGLKNGKRIHRQTMTLHFGKIETHILLILA